MPNENAEQAQARAELRKLEQDPAHGPSDKAKDQTRVDRLDDPSKQKEHKLDPGWTTGSDGNSYHPDYEG